MADFTNTVLMKNKSSAAINLNKDPDWDDERLVYDGVVSLSPDSSPYTLEPGKQVHVGATYDPDGSENANSVGVSINDDARILDMAVGPSDLTDSKVWTIISDDDFSSGLIYDVQDETAVSMTINWANKNSILMKNEAKAAIKIDRDPNYDGMELIFDGVTTMGYYILQPGEKVYVGSTYGTDIGLDITYNSNERFMELAVGPTPISDSSVWSVIADDESGSLTYHLQNQTPDTMTMIWHDK